MNRSFVFALYTVAWQSRYIFASAACFSEILSISSRSKGLILPFASMFFWISCRMRCCMLCELTSISRTLSSWVALFSLSTSSPLNLLLSPCDPETFLTTAATTPLSAPSWPKIFFHLLATAVEDICSSLPRADLLPASSPKRFVNCSSVIFGLSPIYTLLV